MIPGSGFPFHDFPTTASEVLSETQKDSFVPQRPHHVAVCQQETLTFIDLEQEGASPGFSSFPQNSGRIEYKDNEVSYVQSSTNVQEHCYLVPHRGPEGDLNFSRSTMSRRETFTSQAPIPPLCPTFHDPSEGQSQTCRHLCSADCQLCSPDPCTAQRRTSQTTVKEKSIRRKIRVYAPESSSNDPVSSRSLQPQCFFPILTFAEDLSKTSSPTSPVTVTSSASSTLPQNADKSEESKESPAVSPALQPAEQERRRFSASELISRLQLSQRKSSFTLKLGKSLSARVASREHHPSDSLTSNHRSSSRSSGGSCDSTASSPCGPTTQMSSTDSMQRHVSSQKSVKKDLIDESSVTSRSFIPSKCLSRFLPSLVLYQEYSDVVINREIQRQKGAEPGVDEEQSLQEKCGEDSTLYSLSSFCSPRGSAFSLWQDIPDVRSSSILDTFSTEERKLQEAKFELITSEASYIRSLAIVGEHFILCPEMGECLGAQEKQWLFSKLPDVKDVSERFLQDLEQRLEEDILRFDVCDIVLAHCPALRRVYLPYVTNQAYQEQTYQRLLHENTRFAAILARLEEHPICQRLPLTSFLILPFQRITRLKMLVENILKKTIPNSCDEDTATKAFNELKKIVKECNTSVQTMKRTEELIHLNKKIHFESKIFPLISQSRWLVKHGELLEVDTQTMSISGSKLKLPTRPVYLHLFNDCLLLSRKKDMWKFMVFVHAKIEELKVKDISQKLQGISGYIFYLQLCNEPQFKHQILLKAHTESEKQRWITAMLHPNPQTRKDEIDDNQDLPQVQCIKSYQATEYDELALEKADVVQAKNITSDGWIEGVRLSDGEQGWFPKAYTEPITKRSARLRNLQENIRIKCATQKLQE